MAERIGGSEKEDTLCGLCQCGVATSQHLLLDCVFARILWRQSPWKMDSQAYAHMSMQEWVHYIIDPVALLGLHAEEMHCF